MLIKKNFAVFGNPIQHSLSPVIHQQFAEQCGLDICYTKIESLLDKFAEEVNTFFSNGGDGANVTIPFKEQAYKIVAEDNRVGEHRGDDLDVYNDAYTSKSGNTLYVSGGIAPANNSPALGIANTDGVGLVNDITNNLGWQLNNKKILLVGAGGAIRSIIPALARAARGQATSIYITNRTHERTEQLVSYYRQSNKIQYLGIAAAQLQSINLNEISANQQLTSAEIKQKYHFDIIINGSAFGLGNNKDTEEKVNEDFLLSSSLVHQDLLCYDLVYGKDRSTNFTQWATAHSAKQATDGLGMLVEQAAKSFSIWNNLALNSLDTRKVINDLSF